MDDTERLRRLLFTPVRTQPRDEARQTLDRASVEVGVVDGDDVVHYRWGDGKRRALLVHGWSGNAGHLAALADALVGQGFTVLAVDLPGHGGSGGHESSVVHFATAITAANERYGPFHAIVAHSLGAIAATYAMSRGLACDRAVFINPASSFQSLWRLNEKALNLSPERMGRVVTSAEGWLGVSFNDIEPTALAPALSSRLLVIHDEFDPGAPMADSEALVRSWPGARLIKVEKLGHTRVLSDGGVVGHVVDFLSPD